MTSKSGKQTIVIHILPNISRSKGNQTMELGQLIEYNIKSDIFLEKSFTKCDGETIPRPFFKISKLKKVYTVCFYCMPSSTISKYTEAKLQTTCVYLI